MFQKKAYTVDEATKKAEHFCAYQERCHQEVVKKLKEMGMVPLSIDHIITHLIQENYLNEERFARAFARGKFRVKHWGRSRIVAELKQREISAYNMKAALQEIEPGAYMEALHELAVKRLEALREPSKQKRRKKLADYLLYRGWEPHLVHEKINELLPF